MLRVHLFSHRKKSFFRSPLKSHPKQSHRCHESDFNNRDPCNYHKVASARVRANSNVHERAFQRCGCWQVKLMWILFFLFCFHKPSDALNRVRSVISETQSDITSSWWCSSVAVRLMGYPVEAEMV